MAKGWEKFKKNIAPPVTKEKISCEQELANQGQGENEYETDEYGFVTIYDPSEEEDFEFFELDCEKMIEEQRRKNFELKLERSDFEDRSQSPFAPQNKYNSRIVLSHPAIRPHYERYQKHINNTTPTDHQRWMFEEQVLMELKRLHLSENSFDVPKVKSVNNKKYSDYEK